MDISTQNTPPARMFLYTSGSILLLTLLLMAHAPATPLAASIPDGQPDHSTSPHSGPDLVVTNITMNPTNPQAGDTGDISITIQNIGDAVAPAGFRIILYVNPSDTPPTEDTPQTVRLFRGQALDPGKSFTVTRTDHEFSSSNPVLYAWVDPPWENNIVEGNEENNGLLVHPEPDEYEKDDDGDNECTAATALSVNGSPPDSPQQHNLVPLTGTVDVDWIKFEAIRGQTYRVKIEAIGDDTDLYVEYYDFCGNGGSLGSGIEFDVESDQNGPYYLKIGHNQSTYGPDTRYSVGVTTGVIRVSTTPPSTDLTSTPINTPVPTYTSISTPVPTYTSISTPIHTHTPTITPTPTPGSPGATWTLFIYAIGDNNLHPYLGEGRNGMLRRFRELQGQSVEGVQVVIMFDGSDTGDTKYHILDEQGAWKQPTSLPEDAEAEARMDDPETLKNFLKWGFDLYSDSDYYALSILGHASGLIGIGPDDTSSSTSESYLEPTEIRSAIEEVQSHQDRHLHVVHFDGCSFGLFESTSILHGIASTSDIPTYVIASPDTGWGIFAHDVYRTLAGQSATPADYAKKTAQHYAAELTEYGYFYTIAVYDLAYFNEVQEATGNLGNALTEYIQDNSAANHLTLQGRRGKAQIYDSGNYIIDERKDTYVDLLGFTQALDFLSGDDDKELEVKSTSAVIEEVLNKFVFYQDSKSGWATINKDRVYHDLDDAQGMAIFYPYWAMEGPLWERYISEEAQAVSSSGQGNMNNDRLYPGLASNWGWTNFIRTVPAAPPLPDPLPLSSETEFDLPPVVTSLAPLVEGLYDEDESIYLPVVMR